MILLELGVPTSNQRERLVEFSVPVLENRQVVVFLVAEGGSAGVNMEIQGSLNGTTWFVVDTLNSTSGSVKDKIIENPPKILRLNWSGNNLPKAYYLMVL